MAAGGYHSIFLSGQESVYGLGSGKFGENGCGDFVDSSIPKTIELPDYKRSVTFG